MINRPKLGLNMEVDRCGDITFYYTHSEKFMFPLTFEQVNEAVKQYLIKDKGDLISRQAVLDLLYNIYEREIYTSRGNVKKCTAEIDISELKSLPPVTPARPKGEWEEVYAESDGSNSWIEFKCPHCGGHFGIESGEYGWHYTDPIPWKACPMCGVLVEMGGNQNDD